MCVAIPPTNSETAGPGKVWLWLTGAPWRFLFVGGLLSFIFGKTGSILGWSSPVYLAFVVLPFFISGSILTLVPRWLGHDVTYDYSFLKHVATLAPASLLMLIYLAVGWTFFAIISASLVALCYLLLALHLRRMIFWAVHGDKPVAWLTTFFVMTGFSATLALLASLMLGLPDWATFSIWAMNWFSTAPLFLILTLKFLAAGSSRSQLVD